MPRRKKDLVPCSRGCGVLIYQEREFKIKKKYYCWRCYDIETGKKPRKLEEFT